MGEKGKSDRKVILVVDDMGINLRAMKLALDAHYSVRLAKSGSLALSIAGSEKIDLILLDIEMPEMSGFDFIRQMKDNPGIKQPPVIFVTAHATPELLVRAKAAGAAGYVLKPFDPEVLLEKVIEVLRQTAAAGQAGGAL